MHLVTLITALPKSATSAGDLELGQVINGNQKQVSKIGSVGVNVIIRQI